MCYGGQARMVTVLSQPARSAQNPRASWVAKLARAWAHHGARGHDEHDEARAVRRRVLHKLVGERARPAEGRVQANDKAVRVRQHPCGRQHSSMSGGFVWVSVLGF